MRNRKPPLFPTVPDFYQNLLTGLDAILFAGLFRQFVIDLYPRNMRFEENMRRGNLVESVRYKRPGYMKLAGPLRRLEEHRAAATRAVPAPGAGARLVPAECIVAGIDRDVTGFESGPRHECRTVGAAAVRAVAMGDPFGRQSGGKADRAAKTGSANGSGSHVMPGAPCRRVLVRLELCHIFKP